jgi:hypothetical protein
MTMHLKGLMIAGAIALGSLFGCGAVQNAVDCNGICNRYKTCFDSNYDVDKCESNCRDNANSNANYMTDVSDCNNCIDDKSCASATFTCATPCSTVVP